MNNVWAFVGSYWWLLFVFGGAIGGAARSVMAANERRAERRQERFRIKHEAKVAVAEAGRAASPVAGRSTLDKVLAEHDATDERWLAYELDPATLIDVPLLVDVREPLTAAFHRAKRHADLLRPSPGEELDRAAEGEYRDAVHDFAMAFDIAEAEAQRRRQRDFSADEQARLQRAQRLLRMASDGAATPQERQQAYAKARAELDGLLVLPAGALAELERRVAGELDQWPTNRQNG